MVLYYLGKDDEAVVPATVKNIREIVLHGFTGNLNGLRLTLEKMKNNIDTKAKEEVQIMGTYITKDPKILGGTPVIKGTRIPVSLIVRYLADGYTVNDIIEDYPHLTKEAIYAALAYTSKVVTQSKQDSPPPASNIYFGRGA